MNHLTTTKAHGKFAVVYVADGKEIASFPASLNKRIPELEEVEAMIAPTVAMEEARAINMQTVITVETGKFDSKGREIGFTVYVYQWAATGDWYVVVQNARKVTGKWEDFGVSQRGKKMGTEAAAKIAGECIAKDRAKKLN